MQSCIEGLFPFPYVDLSSLFVKSRAKNTYFSTCTHLPYYTTCVYEGSTTTAHVHWDLCQKMKINVEFLCHNGRSTILGLPYNGNILVGEISIFDTLVQWELTD
jgi:hypothetical protein